MLLNLDWTLFGYEHGWIINHELTGPRFSIVAVANIEKEIAEQHGSFSKGVIRTNHVIGSQIFDAWLGEIIHLAVR